MIAGIEKTIETQTTVTVLSGKHCESIDGEDRKLLKYQRENYNARRSPPLDRDSS